MKTSDSITAFAKAMLKAQKAIKFAAKDANNPFFKSKYADLPTVIDAIKPALNDAGIVFIQSAAPSADGCIALTTRLIHESGEYVEDTMTMPIIKNDPQAYGSAMTYARRYQLAAITGLYQDDDDANSATHGANNSSTQAAKPSKKEPKNDAKLDGMLALIEPTMTVAEAEGVLLLADNLDQLKAVWKAVLDVFEGDEICIKALTVTKDQLKQKLGAK